MVDRKIIVLGGSHSGGTYAKASIIIAEHAYNLRCRCDRCRNEGLSVVEQSTLHSKSTERATSVAERLRYYDIHVLDLSPSLETLSMMAIADAKPRFDTFVLPPSLHLNLNTMYAMNIENMPPLSIRHKRMILMLSEDFAKAESEDEDEEIVID